MKKIISLLIFLSIFLLPPSAIVAADKKISELPVVTFVVDTDLVPVVASAVTSQVTVANMFGTNLSSIRGLTFADISFIELTGAGTSAVVTCTGANQILGVNSAGTALECKSTLALSAMNLTAATSSIPFPVGTSAAPTAEGSAYWNSTNNTLTVGNTTTATMLLGKVDGAVTTNTLVKYSGTTGGVSAASTIVEDGTDVNFQALNLVTTGTIQGGIKISSDADGMDAAAMTAAGVRGTLFIATGAGTWILPTAAGGESLCLMDSGTAHDLILDATAGDTIRLKGTEQADAVGITNASGSTTGDFICVVAVAANKWSTMGMQGTWASQ